MAIAISVDNAHVSTGNVTIHISGLKSDDDPIKLYINDTLISSDISPGYVQSFDYTHSFNSKGIYTIKCNYRSQDSNVLTVYVGYDYAIAFGEDAYYSCNGSCVVTATLTESNVAVSGATVTLTGAGSSLTATTDSNGMATFNLSSIVENKNLTVSFGGVSDTAVLYYFSILTLMGSLYCLGRRLETNLKAKGITGIDFTDGLTTLVDEIPNIEPSIGGIVLDTALTCSASRNSVPVGSTVTFTGKLSCSYDDSGQSDDDMEGYIKTALIEFYNGNTLLGSTSTDSNGEYSFSYLTSATGTLSVIASYDGTDYYEDCVSSAVSVVVVSPTPDSISLTSDKSILSYADSEYATLTATVLDAGGNPVSGELVSFDIVDSTGSTVIENIGSDVTDGSGEANVSYYSKGTGTLYIKANVGGILQSIIYEIIDYWRYDDASTDKSSNYSFKNNPNNSTITYDSTNKYYNFNYPSRVPESNDIQLWLLKDYDGQDIEISIDVQYNFSSNKQMVLYTCNQSFEWGNHSPIGTWSSNRVCGSVVNGSDQRNTSGSYLSANTWYTLKFRIQGNTINTYIIQNGSVISEKSTSAWSRTKINSILKVSDYVSWVHFKNLKIKVL